MGTGAQTQSQQGGVREEVRKGGEDAWAGLTGWEPHILYYILYFAVQKFPQISLR